MAVSVSYTHLDVYKRQPLLHRPVKLTVENVSGSIVNQAGEVVLCLYTANIEHKSIFNISLPQVMPCLLYTSYRLLKELMGGDTDA